MKSFTDCPKIIPDLPNRPGLPFDFGLIYTGKPTALRQVIKNIETNNYLQETMDSVGEYLHKAWPEFDHTGAYEDFNHMKNNNIRIYQETLATVSYELLSMFFKLFTNGYTESNLKYFIYAIGKVNMANAILRRTASYLRAIIDAFYTPFVGKGKMLGIGFNDTNIMGGCLLFVTPAETFRDKIVEALSVSKIDMISLIEIYTNRKDGYMEQGLIFEHDIENKLYSDYVSKQTPIGLSSSAKGSPSKEKIVQADIILDLTCMKLIVAGKKLDSGQIPSQTTAVETLLLLTQPYGQRVSNRNLPKSSYASSKNQFNHKIIKPLINIVQTLTKKTLPLFCEGTGFEFEIKLDPSDITVQVVSKVGKSVKK